MELSRVSIGAGVLAVAVALAGLWAIGFGPGQDAQTERSGEVHIASVENNHTERVEVAVFTVTDTEAKVDGNASTVPPGTEEDFGLLDCRDGEFVADRLRILVSTDGEPGYEIERLVELEEGDCGPGGRIFRLGMDGEGHLFVETPSN